MIAIELNWKKNIANPPTLPNSMCVCVRECGYMRMMMMVVVAFMTGLFGNTNVKRRQNTTTPICTGRFHSDCGNANQAGNQQNSDYKHETQNTTQTRKISIGNWIAH